MPNYSVMKNVVAVAVIFSLLINYSLALQIGAFNTGVYGKTKSSKPEVVSMFKEVPVWQIVHKRTVLYS